MSDKKPNKNTLVFKDFPLVRNENTLYLGNPGDAYIAVLQILSATEEFSMKMAQKVSVQIVSTNAELPMKDRVIKRTDKNGLYSALNIAAIWLERALIEGK